MSANGLAASSLEFSQQAAALNLKMKEQSQDYTLYFIIAGIFAAIVPFAVGILGLHGAIQMSSTMAWAHLGLGALAIAISAILAYVYYPKAVPAT